MAHKGADYLAVLQCPAGKKHLDPAHVPPSCAELTARRLAARQTKGTPETPVAASPPRCATCNAPLPLERWGHGICAACGEARRIAPTFPKGDLPPNQLEYIFGVAAYTWQPKIK